MSIKIKIRKLAKEAFIPAYAKTGDAAMDLVAISMNEVDNSTHGYIEYGTGLAIEIPEGFVGLIFPRSSISDKGLILANSVGVIDSGYRGEIKCRFKFIKATEAYKTGDRVAQLMILPIPEIQLEEVEELTVTERAEGGFGSTNN